MRPARRRSGRLPVRKVTPPKRASCCAARWLPGRSAPSPRAPHAPPPGPARRLGRPRHRATARPRRRQPRCPRPDRRRPPEHGAEVRCARRGRRPCLRAAPVGHHGQAGHHRHHAGRGCSLRPIGHAAPVGGVRPPPDEQSNRLVRQAPCVAVARGSNAASPHAAAASATPHCAAARGMAFGSPMSAQASTAPAAAGANGDAAVPPCARRSARTANDAATTSAPQATAAKGSATRERSRPNSAPAAAMPSNTNAACKGRARQCQRLASASARPMASNHSATRPCPPARPGRCWWPSVPSSSQPPSYSDHARARATHSRSAACRRPTTRPGSVREGVASVAGMSRMSRMACR